MEIERFTKILISNRAEIAWRITQTLHKLKIQAVVIFDDREADSIYVKQADEAYSLGVGTLHETFLNQQKIIDIAVEAGCEAIHPGYGFLSENTAFARLCEENNLVFIGPSPEVIGTMGNKAKAIIQAEKARIPTIPRLTGTPAEILLKVENSSFPWLVKASAGGGGKGMHIADRADILKDVIEKSSREAASYFGDDEIYLEKLIVEARHIEVQILADSHGNIVHLFERECTLQRRYQKIIEEAPSQSLTSEQQKLIYKDAIKLAKSVNYLGAGTVEFLLDKNGRHYFLEMNTRIQVEHAVTEMITGIDIVAEQISIAAGNKLTPAILEAKIKGHAIETRLYAENPSKEFMPSPGKLYKVVLPEKSNTRIDSIIEDNYEVLPDFDPMLAKMIVHGKNRKIAIARISELVEKTVVHGINTNIEFLYNLLKSESYASNTVSTKYVEEQIESLTERLFLTQTELKDMVVSAAIISLRSSFSRNKKDYYNRFSHWRLMPEICLRSGDQSYTLKVLSNELSSYNLFAFNEEFRCEILDFANGKASLLVDGRKIDYVFSWNTKEMLLSMSFDFRVFQFSRKDFLSHALHSAKNMDEIELKDAVHAPLNGKVIKILVQPKSIIELGETLLIIESMKMENEIKLDHKATVKKIHIEEGQIVNEGDLLLEFK